MKIIRKIMLSASVCAAFLTACGVKETAETSTEKASVTESIFNQTEAPTEVTTTENTAAETTVSEEMTEEQTAPTEVHTEEISVEVPENAAYRRTANKISNISFFDENDNLILEKLDPNTDGDHPRNREYSYEYNDDGTIAIMTLSNSYGNSYKTYYEYNSDGTIRKETLYTNDELYNTSVYTYDEHSNPVRKEITYIGRIVGEVNVHVLSYEYEYDSDGRILVKKEFMDNDLKSTESYTYYTNGNTASLESQYANLDFNILRKYTYNSENRLIKEEISTSDEETTYIEYEYEFYN